MFNLSPLAGETGMNEPRDVGGQSIENARDLVKSAANDIQNWPEWRAKEVNTTAPDVRQVHEFTQKCSRDCA